MPILTLSHARLGFGERLLLDDAELVLEPREHVALVGRNGSGKSTLLAALAGIVDLDDGERWLMPGVRVALLAQEPAQDEQRTVYESVALGLGDEGKTLAAYHDALALLARSPHDERTQLEVQRLHDEVEQRGWRSGHRIEGVLSRLELDPDARVGTLSGGWQKRVALATALVRDPEVLLLDEPTNHLDIAAIEWLEALIRAFGGAVVCVTHDRRFLDAIAQRIVELDRGKLRSYPGVFAEYRARKALEEHEEALANARMDRLLAQEEAWIRKGVEARRTRNEGRVLRLERLRGARAERRERAGQVRFDMADAERSGRLVAELLNVSKAYGGRTLIRDFTTRILRGDRIGLIGPNGAGKTTLLKLILGDIAPDAGTVRRGTQLQVAYFDQFREQLDPEATLADSISPGADFIEIGGTRRHVITYLGEFMFPPSRARSPVRSLSGGERNRLLLARLFARPANVLVLDEPTNDLDVDTLELLEALLQDYAGTLFLVSHDRAFLDNVVTQTIAFEGDGLLREHVGGYSDWEAWKRRSAAAAADAARSVARAPAEPARSTSPRRGTFAGASRSADAPRTLSGRERAELESLPDTIDTLEQHVSRTQAALSDPSLYRDRPDEVMRLRETLTAAEEALATAYARWEALERRASGT